MDYRLLDFGQGRRLEAIGPYRIDRPCPAAEGAQKARPAQWADVDARYLRRRGNLGGWEFIRPWPASAHFDAGGVRLEQRPTPFGHLGVFPEQVPNWSWLQRLIAAMRAAAGDLAPPRLLNLFAYTGGSTLAAAAAGAAVVHVDASAPSVAAARRNAVLSQLEGAPIRYLTEDVRNFVAREGRRKETYEGVLLDPPAYGHGERGQAWRIERDLWPLLEQCFHLCRAHRGLFLWTGHSQVKPLEVIDWVQRNVSWKVELESGKMEIRDLQGRPLNAGHYVRGRWG